MNRSKAAEPDNRPDHVLKSCTNQLADVITQIFNTSVSQETVPCCLRRATVPKTSAGSRPNYYRPVALTPIPTKSFEKLVLQHIMTSSLPAWTLTSLLSEPKDPQRMSDPLLPTQASHLLRIRASTGSSPSAALQTTMRTLIGRKSTIVWSGARRAIQCSTPAEPRS